MDKQYPILDTIQFPDDLKQLSDSQIPLLCDEIRSFLIHRVLENGGHLASNLGVVELTVAIHRIFNAPSDDILWDVSHQAYVHKILTGRKDRFSELRKPGGISGFTKRTESIYDPFGAGHSSTSLSAAIGIAAAKKLAGDPSYTIAVLGDGAFTGGLIHEALNNLDKSARLILILNENEMSISRNIGGFANHLQKLRQSRRYHRTKRITRHILSHIPLIGKPTFKLLLRTKKALKNAMYNSNYFEDLGMYYLGPIDGHDTKTLERMLDEAKHSGQCTVLHVKTTKGKGYLPAEEHPHLYHSVNPGNLPGKYNFSAEMGRILCQMAKDNPKIIAITAAMADGCGLTEFSSELPQQFFDVGIAEEHALIFAAGLATKGFRPFFAVYSTFLQRGYDNILHDIAFQHLPVTVCIDRAALSSGDGPTHHGIFDVAMLGQLPDISLYAPFDFVSLKDCMERAAKDSKPSFLRYPNKGENQKIREICHYGSFGVRADFLPTDHTDIMIIGYGRILDEILAASEVLRNEGIHSGIVVAEQIFPLQPLADFLQKQLQSKTPILFVEEGIRNGGAAMLLFDLIRRESTGIDCPFEILAIEDPFRTPTSEETILSCHGLEAAQIARRIREILSSQKEFSHLT